MTKLGRVDLPPQVHLARQRRRSRKSQEQAVALLLLRRNQDLPPRGEEHCHHDAPTPTVQRCLLHLMFQTGKESLRRTDQPTPVTIGHWLLGQRQSLLLLKMSHLAHGRTCPEAGPGHQTRSTTTSIPRRLPLFQFGHRYIEVRVVLAILYTTFSMVILGLLLFVKCMQ